jgi:YHS domain-containing protein
MPDPRVAGSTALPAAPPAELPGEAAAPQFGSESQASNGFFDEPVARPAEMPVADAPAEELFATDAAEPALETAEPNPFETESSSGPYTGLELDEHPFAAPQEATASGPEAAVPTTLPTFAAESQSPAAEPVAALLAPPPPADGAASPIPTRLASESTVQATPAPLPATGRTAATPVSASTAPTEVQQKLSRIAERRGLTGFKGFCPVMLRDYRELVDAKLEHTAEVDGRPYWFSSAAAKETFLLNPSAYVPARGGIDVVIFDEIGEPRDGSLDHAVWYRGQLYLFDSSETQAAFSASPQLHQTE